MYIRILVTVCLLGSLLLLTGCDPEEIVHKKVPDPLKEVLTLGQAPGKGTGPGKMVLADPDVMIVAPKANAVFGIGKEVQFEANVKGFDPEAPSPIEITWTLIDEKGRPLKIGNRLKERRKLDLGKYKIQLTAAQKEHKIVKSLSFRVALTMDGKVTLAGDGGLPETQVSLSELEGSVPISTVQTRKDGRYTIEFPNDGTFRIVPHKEGFSFTPLSATVRFSRELKGLDFTAVKGEVRDVKLTASADSDEPLDSICPLQEAFVKFSVASEEKPVRAEASLIHSEQSKERTIPLDEIRGDPRAPKELNPEAPLLKVQIPLGLVASVTEGLYRLRVSVFDEKRHSISADASYLMKLDIPSCLWQTMERAASEQEKGRTEEAVKGYNLIQKLYERAADHAPFGPYMGRCVFDRGLAFIAMALAKRTDKDIKLSFSLHSAGPDSEDGTELNLLGKALSDFNAAVKANPNDLEALLMRGLTKQLAGKYEAALDDYSSVLAMDPRRMDARSLRAQTYLKTLEEKNILKAVDDFTEALSHAADKQCLRDGRRETLKLAVKIAQEEQKKKESQQSDQQESAKPRKDEDQVLAVIPMCKVSEVVNLNGLIRKASRAGEK